MPDAKLLSTGPLLVADIDAEDRMRPVSDTAVDALIASIAQLGGLQDEIHVRRIKRSQKLVLIAGGHRLAAARRLGWETIPAKLWECTDAQAQLMEIDDNLAHAELAPLDLAVFLARRKAVYEDLHPETKRGGNRGNQHTGGWQTDTMSFSRSVAEQRGLSDRHVRRLVTAGEALGGGDLQDLRQAPRQVTLKDLMEIAKIGEVSQRSDVCRLIGEGKARSAADALRALNDPKPKVSSVDKAFLALATAWTRAPMAARRRFVDEHAVALRDLLPEDDA